MKNDNREGGGELKRDGGLLTFFPRKGGGLIREGGLNRGVQHNFRLTFQNILLLLNWDQ